MKKKNPPTRDLSLEREGREDLKKFCCRKEVERKRHSGTNTLFFHAFYRIISARVTNDEKLLITGRGRRWGEGSLSSRDATARDSVAKPLTRIRPSRDTKLQSETLMGKHLRVPNDVNVSHYIGRTFAPPNCLRAPTYYLNVDRLRVTVLNYAELICLLANEARSSPVRTREWKATLAVKPNGRK